MQIRIKVQKKFRIFGGNDDHPDFADHPDFPATLNNLARLHHDIGDYANAEHLYRQALTIRRASLGYHHPDCAISLNNLASLYTATRRPHDAIVAMKESNAIHDLMIGDIFSISSERQRMAFLRIIENDLNITLSLVLRYLHDDQETVNSALDLVLQRKAIGAEALANQRDVFLRGWYPIEARSKIIELNSIRSQIGRLTMAGPTANEDLKTYNQRSH